MRHYVLAYKGADCESSCDGFVGYDTLYGEGRLVSLCDAIQVSCFKDIPGVVRGVVDHRPGLFREEGFLYMVVEMELSALRPVSFMDALGDGID